MTFSYNTNHFHAVSLLTLITNCIEMNRTHYLSITSSTSNMCIIFFQARLVNFLSNVLKALLSNRSLPHVKTAIIRSYGSKGSYSTSGYVLY